MPRKSFKYILIALVNTLLLMLLFSVSIYDLRLLLGDLYQLDELMIQFVLFSGVLITMCVMVAVRRKRSIELAANQKIGSAILLTVFLSGYFYVDYGVNIYDRYFNIDRQSLAAKVELSSLPFGGSKAEGLTYAEYEVLRNWTGYPELSSLAQNIAYHYSYPPDDFLPDYGFSISYEVPVSVAIEQIELETDQFSQYQNFEISGNRKLVSYSEGRR